MGKASEFDIKTQVSMCVNEVKRLVKTRVIESHWPEEMFWPVMTSIVVHTRDLVAKSRTIASSPIDFTDDIVPHEKVHNGETLIKFVRDALCHVESDKHKIGETMVFTRNVAYGKCCILRTDEYEFSSDYEDDIAIFIGRHRAYYRRHILRAFNESVDNLKAFLD